MARKTDRRDDLNKVTNQQDADMSHCWGAGDAVQILTMGDRRSLAFSWTLL